MYAWIWRHLPGPVTIRLVIVAAVLVGVFFLLMDVVFPWVETLMPYGDVAVCGKSGRTNGVVNQN
jgi:hypothetical protein